MSNYTRIVAWNNKDALADTDTAKVISGDDFWTEFGAVATAVNSKADAAGDIGQAFSTSTAASSSNTTIAASTEYVTSALVGHDTKQNILDAIYPVGALYTTTISTNPAAALGGTWAAFGAGKVMVGIDASDTDFDASEETGGAKTHTLTTAETPSHNHFIANNDDLSSSDPDLTASNYLVERNGTGDKKYYLNGSDTAPTVGLTSDIGGDSEGATESHNNLQPYVVVYMWKRTA